MEFLMIRALVRGCCREPQPPPLPPCLPPLVPPPPLPPPPFPPFLLASALLKSSLSGMMEKAARQIVPSSRRQAICAGPAATARTPRRELRADEPAPVPYLFQRSATSLILKQDHEKNVQTQAVTFNYLLNLSNFISLICLILLQHLHIIYLI